MRKIVAMTAFNRPVLLAVALDALRAAGAAEFGWRFVIRVEPSPIAHDVLDVIEASGLFKPDDVFLNDRRAGPNENPRLAIVDAVERGADIVLYHQDDCVLAPDALRLVDWWTTLPERDRFLCLWLLAYESDPARPADVMPSRGEAAKKLQGCSFHSGGAFAFTAAAWRSQLSRWWHSDARGSDWSIGARMDADPSVVALVPALSRANHTGRTGGTFCTPEFHDRLFGSLVMSDGTRSDFRLAEAAA
jgi:hypothetical protein